VQDAYQGATDFYYARGHFDDVPIPRGGDPLSGSGGLSGSLNGAIGTLQEPGWSSTQPGVKLYRVEEHYGKSMYIDDLAPATTYKVSAVAWNNAGSTPSGELTFVMSGWPPAENRPPVIHPPPVFRIGAEEIAKGEISAFDPDGDALALTFTQGAFGAVTGGG
jgi:hypothetical protein